MWCMTCRRPVADGCSCPERGTYADGFEAALTLFWQNVCLERAAMLANARRVVAIEARAEREWRKPSAGGFWQDTLDNYDREIAKLRAWGGAA